MKRNINIIFEGKEHISIVPTGAVGVDDLLRTLFALTDLLAEHSELNSIEISEQLVKYMKDRG